MKKRLLGLLLAITMLAGSTIYVSAEDVNNVDAIRNRMISYGMPVKIVNRLPDDIVMQYCNIEENDVNLRYFKYTEYLNMTNIESSYSLNNVSVTKATITEITEEECYNALLQNNFAQPMGTIRESYMILGAQASNIEGRNYIVSATYVWLNNPICKLTDYFALTIHDTLAIVPNTEYAMLWHESITTITPGSYVYEESVVSEYYQMYASGVGGHCINTQVVPSITNEEDNIQTTITNYGFCGYLKYDAVVAEVNPDGRIDSAVYATYAHRIFLPAIGISISLPTGVSASISPAYAFDFMHTTYNFEHIDWDYMGE